MPAKKAASAALANPVADEQQALQAALAAVLKPLADLAVARGLPYSALDEMLKQAVVASADQAHAELLPHRRASRVATATGINRREVTRLIQILREGRAGEVAVRRSSASEVFARWLSNPRYLDGRGQPLPLPRQTRSDAEPSFESLAQSVTRDVHPRSLLDELLRLGLATHNEATDTVALAREAFVPRGDMARMFGVLKSNVGDHFAAAVANVLADSSRHFEQAVYADGLSAESVEMAHQLVSAVWSRLLQAAVPALEAWVERDRDKPDATHRIRIGLFSYDENQDAKA